MPSFVVKNPHSPRLSHYYHGIHVESHCIIASLVGWTTSKPPLILITKLYPINPIISHIIAIVHSQININHMVSVFQDWSWGNDDFSSHIIIIQNYSIISNVYPYPTSANQSHNNSILTPVISRHPHDHINYNLHMIHIIIPFSIYSWFPY